MSKRFKVSTVVSDASALAELCDTLGSTGMRFSVSVMDDNGASEVAPKEPAPQADEPSPAKAKRSRPHFNRRPYDGARAHEVVVEGIKAAGKPLDAQDLKRVLKLRGYNPASTGAAITRARLSGWIKSVDGRKKFAHFGLTDLGQSMTIRWSPGAAQAKEAAE